MVWLCVWEDSGCADVEIVCRVRNCECVHSDDLIGNTTPVQCLVPRTHPLAQTYVALTSRSDVCRGKARESDCAYGFVCTCGDF